MKTFQVMFRKTYEVKHHIEVEAKTEKQARKIADKIAEDIDPGEDQSCVNVIEEADDFCIWEGEP